MTKRILLHVWQALSVVLLSLAVFQSWDELLTRREGILALSAVLAACLLTVLSFRILSEKDLTAGLTVSAFIAFLFCLGAEYVSPLPVYLKTPPKSIRAREGYITVALAWMVAVSVTGVLSTVNAPFSPVTLAV